jgi:MFS family permease
MNESPAGPSIEQVAVDRVEDDAVAPRHYAFLALLTLLNVINFIDRQLLASFANFIKPELGLTATEYGLLTGFAFIVFYATMGLFAGALADMFHRPRLLAAGIALWSALTAVSGAAVNFVTLALPRMLIGVGESVLTPTSMSMLSDRFPTSRLGFASGFYYMGVPIGSGISLLIAGYLGPAIGWRNCFYILGAIGLALAVVMLFVRETPRRAVAGRAADAPRQSMRELVRTLFAAMLQSPALMLTIAGGVCWHFILGAATFDQIWFVEERGFERAEIARYSGWIAMVAGVFGTLIGGAGGDWFQRRTGLGRPMFLCVAMLLMAPINVAYRFVDPGSLWFWAAMFVGSFQVGLFYGPTFSTVQELVPPQIRATVVAFYILALNLVGLGIGITAGGVLVDSLIGRGIEEPYTKALFAMTVLSLLSIPLYYIAGRRFAADRDRLFARVAG